MEPDQIRRLWLRQSISLPIFFALLFAPAGTLNYWQAWVYGILFMVTTIGIGVACSGIGPSSFSTCAASGLPRPTCRWSCAGPGRCPPARGPRW